MCALKRPGLQPSSPTAPRHRFTVEKSLRVIVEVLVLIAPGV